MALPYGMRGNRKKHNTLRTESQAHDSAHSAFEGVKAGSEATSAKNPAMQTGMMGQATAQIRSITEGDAGASEALKGPKSSSAPARPKAAAPVMGGATRKWDREMRKRQEAEK